jgi:hypothetical protein
LSSPTSGRARTQRWRRGSGRTCGRRRWRCRCLVEHHQIHALGLEHLDGIVNFVSLPDLLRTNRGRGRFPPPENYWSMA